jgi:hypothetical protein
MGTGWECQGLSLSGISIADSVEGLSATVQAVSGHSSHLFCLFSEFPLFRRTGFLDLVP